MMNADVCWLKHWFFLRYEVVFNKKGNNELYKNLFGILLEISGWEAGL